MLETLKFYFTYFEEQTKLVPFIPDREKFCVEIIKGDLVRNCQECNTSQIKHSWKTTNTFKVK